jgi:hypothetical protein
MGEDRGAEEGAQALGETMQRDPLDVWQRGQRVLSSRRDYGRLDPVLTAVVDVEPTAAVEVILLDEPALVVEVLDDPIHEEEGDHRLVSEDLERVKPAGWLIDATTPPAGPCRCSRPPGASW